MVDGLCLCCLYLLAPSLSAQRLVGIFLTYNMLAFLSQPITGVWADRMKQRHWMLLFSVMLLALAVLTTALTASKEISAIGMPIVAVLQGMGNSLFHVWGGKQVAVGTGNDIRSLGFFVATGAIGLSIGYVFFSWLLLCIFVIAISLLSVFYITIDTESVGITNRPSTKRYEVSTSVICLIILALMMAAFTRQRDVHHESDKVQCGSAPYWWGFHAGKDGRWMGCLSTRHHQLAGRRHSVGTCLLPVQEPGLDHGSGGTVCRELHYAHHTLSGQRGAS